MDGICIYCKKILWDVSKNICEDCENKIKGETIMSDVPGVDDAES